VRRVLQVRPRKTLPTAAAQDETHRLWLFVCCLAVVWFQRAEE
jgi:hypothetical protein